MNRTDRTVVFQIGLTIAVLVLIAIFIGWLAGRYAHNPAEQISGAISDTDFLEAEATKRILPVGHVITQSMVDANPELAKGAEPPKVAVVVRTGDEVVDYLCASCHRDGVGAAPRLDDAADWGTRYAQGMDALMEIGINGKAGTTMMARGGDPSLSDDDIWNSIVAMLKRAGVSITESERSAEANIEAEEAEAGAAQVPAVEATVETVTENIEAVVDTATGSVDTKIENVNAVIIQDGADTTIKSMATGAGDMIVDKIGEAVKPAVESGDL